MQFDIKNKEDRNKLSYEVAFYIMMFGRQDMKRFLYIPNDYVTEGGFPLGSVQTGDNSHILAFAMLLLLSGAGLIKSNQKKEEEKDHEDK